MNETSGSAQARPGGSYDRTSASGLVPPAGNGRAVGVSLVQRPLETTGSLVRFGLQVLRELPAAVRLYPSEVFRQASLLIRANALVVLFMIVMYGAVFSVTYHFLFSQLGLDSFLGAAHSIGTIRGPGQVVFGWVIAAKVGCGICAELGAMRISEEIDAMEVMGVRSVPYLAGTRVVAALIVFPLLWAIALAVEVGIGFLLNVGLLATSSGGAYGYFYFLFQNPYDFVAAIIWATSVALIIILVSCYYGFSASGGAIGVGRSTAQSMLVNVVLTSLGAMIFIQLFYGNIPNAPIGN